MRYDRQVTLIAEGEKVYDWNSGNYEDSEPITYNYWANITDAGLETRQLAFGDVDISAKVVRFRHRLPFFNRIIIDGQPYNIKTRKRFRASEVLFVSESQ